MDEKIKTWTLRFPAKENPNMEKALFDWPIVLQYDVKAKYRLISRKFFGHEVFSPERSLNQPKATRVCIRSINQSNRSISVRWLFLYCWRVVISRSCENRFKQFRVKKVSGETFQPVETSSAAVWTLPKTVEAFPFSPCLLNTENFVKTKMKSAHRKQNRRHYQPCLYLTLQ